MEHGKEQMLHIYRLCMLYARFQDGKLEDVAGLGVQHQLAGSDRCFQLVLTDFLFQFFLYALGVDAQPLEQVKNGRILLSEDTEQQMLRTHRAAGQARRLFPAESKDLRNFW